MLSVRVNLKVSHLIHCLYTDSMEFMKNKLPDSLMGLFILMTDKMSRMDTWVTLSVPLEYQDFQ